MDESLVDGVSERAHVSRDCVNKLGGPFEMEVRSLVHTTEQAIQAFLKEDCESNIALINSLEEISFKLWLEANSAFLHENSLCEDPDSDCWQWDEECFFTGSYRSSSAEDCAGTCTPRGSNHQRKESSRTHQEHKVCSTANKYPPPSTDIDREVHTSSDCVSHCVTSEADIEREDSGTSSITSSIEISCSRDRPLSSSGYLGSCESDRSICHCEHAYSSCVKSTSVRHSSSPRHVFCESAKMNASDINITGRNHREDDWVVIEQDVSQSDYEHDWLMISSRFNDCNTFSTHHSNSQRSHSNSPISHSHSPRSDSNSPTGKADYRTFQSFSAPADDTESFTHSHDSGIRSPGILHSTAISYKGVQEFGRFSRMESSVEYTSVFETTNNNSRLQSESCLPQDRSSQLGMMKEDWMVISLYYGSKYHVV